MMDDSIKLAQVWIELRDIKDKLDNEILPISGHLGIGDPELMIAMEELSKKIESHFDSFKLIVETKKDSKS
jgi:uridine phosphorylase